MCGYLQDGSEALNSRKLKKNEMKKSNFKYNKNLKGPILKKNSDKRNNYFKGLHQVVWKGNDFRQLFKG